MDEWTLEQAYLAAANMIERKAKMFGGGDGTTGESPASGNGTGQVPIEQMISMINSEM